MNGEQDLQALYRRTVLEHSRHPHNFRRLEPADRVVVGHNPLCGDKITLYLCLDDNRIINLTFEGTGCAISVASASIMTDMLRNRSIEAARHEIEKVMRQFDTSTKDGEPLEGEMATLGGVRAFPSRIKCATLAWKALEGALDKSSQTITTEE